MAVESAETREERRVVTVLFADLVGFTERSEQLDPEDVRAWLARYYARLRAELEAHGGVVDKFIGDAVVAIFGAPVAHEDDPERAVRAALAIRDWARGRDDVSLRIGVNTGEALVALEQTTSGLGMVAGDMVNTAARIQAAAPADGVLVGERTRRATLDAFDYEEREPIVAKGKSAPVRVWEPLAARAPIGGRRLGGAPLVGRARELDVLRAALERARVDREPQLVTLVGVPGIGKTRLVRELEALARGGDPPAVWLEGRSPPYGAGTSFSSLGEMVTTYAGIVDSDAASEAESKLRAAVEALVRDPSDARWLEGHLRPLVGLGGDEGPREDRQAEAMVAWRRFFEALAARGPLVLVFDDLQWADDAVLAFVDELVAHAAALPLLVVATARPELLDRRPGWGGGKPNTATVSLAPLADADTLALVRSLAGELELDERGEQALLRRAGGNPLYAEEFVRIARERDPTGALPDSVQGIVAARLDGLEPEEKELLQDASVVGQEFWAGAVAHVHGAGRDAAEEMLRVLQRKEFVRRLPASALEGDARYAFRHPLIREVAYEQIPRARRAGKHRLAAEWTEALPADRAEERADLLAHHYVRALDYLLALGEDPGGLEGRAARALREAGDHARSLHSLDAAADRYRRALGLAADELERAEIALALAETELRVGAVAEAHARLEHVLAAARSHGRAELLARAALARGGVGLTVWDPDEALVALLEESLDALGEESPALRARLLARLAVELYYVPPPSRREELSEEAVRLARECGAPDALVDALNARHAALWSPDRLEARLPVARELVELAEEIGDRERSLQARTWLVLDLVESGDLDAARRAIDDYERLSDSLGIPAFAWWVPAWRAMLAVVEGRFDEARRLADDARATGERAGETNARIYWEIVSWHADFEQRRNLEAWVPVLRAGIARGNAAGAYRCGLAELFAVSGRDEEARRTLAELGPDGLAGVPRDMNWFSAACQYAVAVTELGDAERAAQAYRTLAPYAGRTCLTARAAAVWGPVDAYLGRLAGTIGRYDEGERHLLAALEAAERMRAPTIAVRAKAWYADVLRARGRPEDLERADALAREAEAEAGRIGLALSLDAAGPSALSG
ncbi:MAG TPA: AAA family ATPase [Gaiellaceae bacterium]|nr:AAA family ATPase [Gaiellaceae bacterium]